MLEKFTKLYLNNDNNNNDTVYGNDAIYSNIIACVSIGDMMKSLLGPKSRDKLIIDKDTQEIIVTNDGYTVLKSISLKHPVSRMMVELSCSMDTQNGDGTTSVVVLSSLLLRKSFKLLSVNNIHPIKIINGFINASKITIDTIKCMSVQFDIASDHGIQLLSSTCSTTLNSKLISHTNPILSKLAVNSVLLAYKSYGTNISTHSINILSIAGDSVENSSIYPFLIIKHKSFITPLYHQDQVGSDVKIVFLNISLNSFSTTSNTRDSQDIETILNQQENNIKSIVVYLKRNGITVVGILEDLNYPQLNISNLLLSYFNKAKISVLFPFSFDKMRSLSDKLNIPIISDLNSLLSNKSSKSPLQFKSFKSITNEIINTENTIQFQTHDDNDNNVINPTILLRGTTEMELNETERALRDALCVLRNLVKNPIVVPGGSACEMESSKRINDYYSHSISGSGSDGNKEDLNNYELISMLSFAESLEEIAETLCQNSGINNYLEIVLQLKQIHKDGGNNNNQNTGIDLKTNSIGDMFKLGVLETLENKLSQISMATEIVTSILKIDQILYTTK